MRNRLISIMRLYINYIISIMRFHGRNLGPTIDHFTTLNQLFTKKFTLYVTNFFTLYVTKKNDTKNCLDILLLFVSY